MTSQISDPSVVVNNVAISVVPNSVSFTEGFGEQNVLVQSAGNGVLEQVFSNDVETNVGMVKFSMRSTPRNIEIARQWKANRNQNVVAVTATLPDGQLTRTFTGAVLTSDYEVNLSADGEIEIEFKTNKPTI